MFPYTVAYVVVKKLTSKISKQFFLLIVISIYQVCTSEDSCRYARISELFVYEKFSRVPAETVEAGDICAVCGIDDIQVCSYFCDVI